MPNVAMCKKVYDYITSHPDKHDQNWFENRNGCNTTRCIAGWAAYLDGWRRFGGGLWVKDGVALVEDIGRSVLGLSEDEADRIFLEMDKSIATTQLGVHAGVVRQEDVDRMCGERDASFVEGLR